MITVDDALAALFDLVPRLPAETVPLAQAAGRVLVSDGVAQSDQPPFAASAMDGYAVAAGPVTAGMTFRVIGESAAGRRFDGTVGPGEAVRIFTGAPIPEGAGRVILQEDCSRLGTTITITGPVQDKPNIRPAGADFRTGATVSAPRRLGPRDIALLAAMNVVEVQVARRPTVALIATGDELVMPGETPGPDQIIASNNFGLHALVAAEGAVPRLLPIARDTPASLHMALELAEGADLVITIGGASVGDHDIVAEVAAGMGLERAFYKVAMRPGKPLMAGRLGEAVMIGLPGNPVSSMVCGHVFLRPVLAAMQGLPARGLTPLHAPLLEDLPPNGPRQHYMRARLDGGGIRAFPTQDSALLSVLAEADALLIRPIDDGPRKAGELVAYLPI